MQQGKGFVSHAATSVLISDDLLWCPRVAHTKYCTNNAWDVSRVCFRVLHLPGSVLLALCWRSFTLSRQDHYKLAPGNQVDVWDWMHN